MIDWLRSEPKKKCESWALHCIRCRCGRKAAAFCRGVCSDRLPLCFLNAALSRESVSGVPGYFGCTEQITVENRMDRVRVSVPQISVFTHKIALLLRSQLCNWRFETQSRLEMILFLACAKYFWYKTRKVPLQSIVYASDQTNSD